MIEIHWLRDPNSACVGIAPTENKTYPVLIGAFEMAILSGVRAFTYDSVMAKYCGDKSSSSIVIGARDCIIVK